MATGQKKKAEGKAIERPVTHEDDPILTYSEVGRQLGKYHTTIARWVKDGLLTGMRHPSGMPGVRQSQINQFLGGSALDSQVKEPDR